MSENVIEEIIDDAEELFPPRPGGMVDKTRRQNAQGAPTGFGTVPAPPRKANEVPTQERVPEVAQASTMSMSTLVNPFLRLIGADPNRKAATVMTLDEPVVISFNGQSAKDPRNAATAAGQSANGFVLPTNIPVAFDTTSEIWVTATSATPTRVSFYRQSFGD